MKEIIQICEKLKKINKKAYCIGSFCISKKLGIFHEGDIDMATDALPEEIEKVLNVVGNIGKKYGTLIVKEGNEKIEITTFRKDIGSVNQRRPTNVEFTNDLKQDASRRDFTINAIYYDPLEDKFIDPFGGIKDLENKIIRFVGDINERLDEDILRLIRFARFKSKFDLDYAEKSYNEIIIKRLPELKNIAIERIKAELDKIIVAKYNIRGLEYLKYIGFFKEFLPELDKLSDAPGGPRHHLEGNVWVHTLMVVNELNNETEIDNTDLYWTCLLHDIGKAETVSFDENKNVHYYNHDKLGAKMFKNISKRLKFSKDSTDKICWLIDNHIKIGELLDMKKLKASKFMMNKYFPELLILCKCDSRGKIPRDEKYNIEASKFYHNFIAKVRKTKFLTGHDIMEKYPNLQGKKIGEKLEEENDKILLKI